MKAACYSQKQQQQQQKMECLKIKHIFTVTLIGALVHLNDIYLKNCFVEVENFLLVIEAWLTHRIKKTVTISIYIPILFLPVWSKKISLNQYK